MINQTTTFRKRFQLFAFLLFIGITNNVSAQDFFFNYEIGYNMHFMKPEGANFVVNRYNETRNFLDTEMKEFGYFDGLTVAVGLGADNLGYFDVGFNVRGQKRFAAGNSNGSDVQRDLRIRNNGVYFGAGFPIGADGVRVVPGIRAELSFLRAHTRVGLADNIKDEYWDEIYDGTLIHGTFVCKFMLGALVIEPYYTLELFPNVTEYGFEYVNEEINPNTYQNDPDYIPFGGRGFGLRLVFSTGFLEF